MRRCVAAHAKHDRTIAWSPAWGPKSLTARRITDGTDEIPARTILGPDSQVPDRTGGRHPWLRSLRT